MERWAYWWRWQRANPDGGVESDAADSNRDNKSTRDTPPPPKRAQPAERAASRPLGFMVSSRGLKINHDKTEEVEFLPWALVPDNMRQLQYLGFLFDGDSYLLRQGTLAKYYRRM